MPTLKRSQQLAKRDRLYARRVDDLHYRVSSKGTRKRGDEPYQVFGRIINGQPGWKCNCVWSRNNNEGPCKHIGRVIKRYAAARRAANRRMVQPDLPGMPIPYSLQPVRVPPRRARMPLVGRITA
jgi:hypothetical protein